MPRLNLFFCLLLLLVIIRTQFTKTSFTFISYIHVYIYIGHVFMYVYDLAFIYFYLSISVIFFSQTFAWVTLLCLTAQIIVTLAQVQVSLNYDSPAISMSPALSKPGLSPARTPPPSPARSLSSISMSFVSPSKMSSASLSPSTEADLHLLETDKEETESSNIIN